MKIKLYQIDSFTEEKYSADIVEMPVKAVTYLIGEINM